MSDNKAAFRLAVITGDPSLPDETKRDQRYNEEDLAYHQVMRDAFAELDGYEVHHLDRHESLFDDLARLAPDLVVNFCDTGFRNVPTHELHVAARLELLGLPYTGASPQAMVLAFDKQIVRLVAKELAVPVPDEHFLRGGQSPDWQQVAFPVLLKPNAADGSIGITQDAVAENAEQAESYLAWLRETLPGRDILVQAYLSGREFSVGIIGNADDGLEILQPLEMDFSRLPEELAPILSYESKAIPDSPYYTDIGFKPAEFSAAELQEIRGWAEVLFRRFALRDYGRLDFRCDAQGRPKLMEVNPNPAWSDDGKLAIMSELLGVSYPQMLEKLVMAARRRLSI